MPGLNHLPQILLFAALVLRAAAPAQQISRQLSTGERHITSDPASALYRRSTFAHGFIHGYERGFHLADLDYHVARLDRKIEQAREYRDADYRSCFGDKKIFERGYREGFLQGYDHSIHSRHFRAAMAGSVVAGSLENYNRSSRDLDAGFAVGYFAQHRNPQSAPVCPEKQSPAYCDGLAFGAEFAVISSGASPVIAKTELNAFAVK